MANYTLEELYGGYRAAAEFKRIPQERLAHLEACERTLNSVYQAARASGLIGEHDGAERLLSAIGETLVEAEK